jgi:pimeloyl-ACP methyl ester carboxylesterase
MSLYVLVPGAGGSAWYWSRVAPLLEKAGHTVLPIDLPGDDPALGLPHYVDIVVEAIGARSDVVLVAQSLGGFTAPLVGQRVPLTRIVLVNAMVPTPGETAGDWWGNVGAADARVEAAQRHGYPTEFDLQTYFLHDVDPAIAAEGEPYQRAQSNTVFEAACAFAAWPAVPIQVICGADDRIFPLDLQQRLARHRLGVEPDVVPGGHLVALSQPELIADRLLRDGARGPAGT